MKVEAPRCAVTLDEVRAHRDVIMRLGEPFGVRNIRVFGSVARGEATPDSDLDLLVDVGRGHGYFDMAGFALGVEDQLGVMTQAATPGGLKLRIRDRVLHILVTEPLPPTIRHKVCERDYVGAVTSDDDSLACSAAVGSTPSGTVLIGSIRAHIGYRPACADHLPVIGPGSLVAGLYHATGHEGAGIGLAPATAELLTALVDHAPFSPGRFPAPATPLRLGGHDGP